MLSMSISSYVCYISNTRRNVSSPDETSRSTAEYFVELRGFSSGDETLCRMLNITSQTK